jgi:diguanylate cyclase (GGDEF)-like protein
VQRLKSVLSRFLERFDRSTLVAYGGWALLSLLLVTGTLTTLDRAEFTERAAVLDRAEAGAATLEQTMLRVFGAVQALQSLAQTRLRLQDAGNTVGALTIEQQLRDSSNQPALGILDLTIIKPDGTVDWSSNPPGGPDWLTASALPSLASAGTAALTISPPILDPNTHVWVVRVSRALYGSNGQREGTAVVGLTPLALSGMIAPPDATDAGRGEASMVQLRPGGAIIARSITPVAALSQHVAPNDPVVVASSHDSGGQFRDRAAGVDRLVGFRAPPDLPIVVSRSFSTEAALSDFYGLRRIVLSVVLALVVGAMVATRLFLSNFLLRQRLGEQALRDPLTGLHNRRFFAEVMAHRMQIAKRDGDTALVLLIDLDGFKQVNDTRGHPVGDGLLRDVAARLSACVGPEDVVMRLGGDEFAVVRLGRTQRRDATSLARFIVNELSEVYEIDGYHLRISASVGVSMPPDGGENLNDLLRSADIALYFVKAEGGSAYQLFDPAMENTVRTRRALEIDLREALGRNELEVYFQPLVHLDPRRVSGFEALLRWHHPTLGMVMPSRFIPVAEETGLIAPIGEWVLRQSCLEAARWPGQTRVAVNLSPVQFERSDIVDIVSSALRESRLEPSRLELEITEGVVMRDMGDILSTMRRLQGLGVRLALDDFGTGYSSLSYLRSFPFDKVKIDGSFLADLHGDGGTIIRAVLGLCVHLGLDSLVEGVETDEQLDWLRQEGCTEVQGHLFSMPRPASGVPEIIGAVAGRAARRWEPVVMRKPA